MRLFSRETVNGLVDLLKTASMMLLLIVTLMLGSMGALWLAVEGPVSPAEAQRSDRDREVRALEKIADELEDINRTLERRCR